MKLAQFERIMGRRPFRPFTLVLGNGEHFEIKHPEQLLLSKDFVAYGVRKAVDFDTHKLVIYWIDMRHIAYFVRG